VKLPFRVHPLGTSAFISQWALATFGLSIIALFDGGFLVGWLSLAPSRVWQGEVWRLITWPLVETGPMSLIITLVAIIKFGGDLATRWGDGRLERYVVRIAVGAGAIATVIALVAGSKFLWRAGGWAITDALVIAWARQFPATPVTLYGVLSLSGQRLIQVTIGSTVVFALYAGPVATAAELAACVLALTYPRKWLRS
jgi:membrane associated rhomboid family serine protease